MGLSLIPDSAGRVPGLCDTLSIGLLRLEIVELYILQA